MRKYISVNDWCLPPRWIGVLFFFIFFSCLAYTQLATSDFTQYGTKQGFTDDNVTCMTQDHFGFLWVGTTHGLNRFDGFNVEPFLHETAKTSLLSEEISGLYWKDSTELLVSTKRGLHSVNIETFSQKNILIPPGPIGQSSKVNNIRNILSDQSGNFYITTRTGFYQFNKDWELVFRYDDYDEANKEYSGGFGSFAGWLDHENIIVSGQQGFYLYYIKEKKLTKIDGDHPKYLLFKIVNRLRGEHFVPREIKPGLFLVFFGDRDTLAYVDEIQHRVIYSRLPIHPLKKEFEWRSSLIPWNDSTIWISGHFSGFFKIMIQGKTGVVKMDTTKFLSSFTCNTIFKDNDQRMWIGTNAGILKRDQKLMNIEFGNFPEAIVAQNPKASFFQFTTDQDHLYAVGPMSGGMYVFRKKDLAFEGICHFDFPSFSNRTCRELVTWNADTILCGTEVGLFWYSTTDHKSGLIALPDWSLQHNWVSDLFVDRYHHLWVLTNQSAGYYYSEGSISHCRWVSLTNTIADGLTQLFHSAEDPFGNIWLAGQGLARFNHNQNAFDFYSENFPSLPDDSKMIEAIACDQDGGIWFANATNGLIFFNPDLQDTIVYTPEDGLPDQLINAIATDHQYIWVACHSGVARINTVTRQIITAINKREINWYGISSNKFYFDDQEKMFYLGLGQHMMRFRPGELHDQVKPPGLRVESIEFGNDSMVYNPPKKMYTNWNHRNLALTFCAINFNDAEDQLYSYRTGDNADTAWIHLGKQRKIFFSSLNAGRHDVQIKVSSANHRWPAQKQYFSIIIRPPFWQTWWFYVLCLASLIASIYALFNYRIRHLKKVLLVRERISQDLHDEVGATLSGIAMYSYLTKEQMKSGQIGEMEKSLNVIQQSSTEMVTKLNDIIWAVDPQHDSLQKLIQRLEEYTIEIAATKHIRVEVAAPRYIEQIKVPMKTRRNIYLICKEAINNAVKYSDATILELVVSHVDHSLEFEIRDNGIGFDPESIKRGNGLDNMQKRADDIEAKLRLETHTGKGVTISVQVGLKE